VVDQILRDHDALRDPDADPELEALKTAVLLEDVFEVVLTDADLDPRQLGDAAAVRSLLARLRPVR
jgi:hypothetical protein